MKVTAVFDIGKTNKKFFLFDEDFKEVWQEYTRIEEIEDEDGFPCDDLSKISKWIMNTFYDALSKPEFDIKRLNFSTYGASFVHIDEEGVPVTPLYNYLKPYPQSLQEKFFSSYGPAGEWARRTASPSLGMLNSALQIYWLKYQKPNLFSKVKWSMHLPQYFSYMLTGKPTSEYTSIGCHTGMWNFEKNEYDQWIKEEGIEPLLPSIVPATKTVDTIVGGKKIKIGVGIHDSSAALLPFILKNQEPFMVLSTGTWSITLNPFNSDMLSKEDLTRDCLNYLQVDGRPVKASRLFLGNEYKIWTQHLAKHFNVEENNHKNIHPDKKILESLHKRSDSSFKWESLDNRESKLAQTDLSQFSSYEEAYHKLIVDLVNLQVEALLLAKGENKIRKIFVDGGFVDNPLFIQLLTEGLPDLELICSEVPLGSAMGAAMAVSDIEENYAFN